MLLAHAARLLAQAQLASALSFVLYGLESGRWLNGERKSLFCALGALAVDQQGDRADHYSGERTVY